MRLEMPDETFTFRATMTGMGLWFSKYVPEADLPAGSA
jgi:hypothetical protein